MISVEQIQKTLNACLKQLSSDQKALDEDQALTGLMNDSILKKLMMKDSKLKELMIKDLKSRIETLLKNITEETLQAAHKQLVRIAEHEHKRKKVTEDLKLGEDFYALAQCLEVCFEKYFEEKDEQVFYFFQAIKLYQFSVYCNYNLANTMLGKHYFLGNKVVQFERDYNRAHEYFLEGARGGCYKSQIMMANSYLQNSSIVIKLFEVLGNDSEQIDSNSLEREKIEVDIVLFYSQNKDQDKHFKKVHKELKSATEYLESASQYSILALVQLLDIYMENTQTLDTQGMVRLIRLAESVLTSNHDHSNINNIGYNIRVLRHLIQIYEDQATAFYNIKKALKCNMDLFILLVRNQESFERQYAMEPRQVSKLNEMLEKLGSCNETAQSILEYYHHYENKLKEFFGRTFDRFIGSTIRKIKLYGQLETKRKKEENELMTAFFEKIPSFTPLKNLVPLIQIYTLEPVKEDPEPVLKITMGSSNIDG